jgi:hypothetical protein
MAWAEISVKSFFGEKMHGDSRIKISLVNNAHFSKARILEVKLIANRVFMNPYIFIQRAT